MSNWWNTNKQQLQPIKSVTPTPSKEARIEWLKKAAKKRRYSNKFYRDYK